MHVLYFVGFRVATLLSIGLVTLGCILRCISFQPPAVTWYKPVLTIPVIKLLRC